MKNPIRSFLYRALVTIVLGTIFLGSAVGVLWLLVSYPMSIVIILGLGAAWYAGTLIVITLDIDDWN